MTALGSVRKAAIFIAVVLGIYFLQWGKDFLIPLVVAFFLADVLEAPTRWLTNKARFPNALAVTVITTLLAVVALGGMLLLSKQVFDLTAQLPNYRDNIIEKIRSVRSSAGDSLSRITGTISEVSAELSSPAATTQPGEAAATTQPVQVEVVSDPQSGATGYLTPLLTPLGNIGIVFALMFFFLLERDLMGHRMRWLLRKSGMGVTSETIDSASELVGRYLRMQLVVNVSSGILVAISMWLIGLPNAALLGAIAAALRYIPYVGPLVGMLLPTTLAIAVFPDWNRPIVVLALLLGIELITNMVLEPLLYGSSTGVSSTGVVLVAFFWGWIWGGMGLLLAMPMTVWIVIVGRHVPGLKPLATFLSSESIGQVEMADDTREHAIAEKEEGWAE